jgi:hypothetical protein
MYDSYNKLVDMQVSDGIGPKNVVQDRLGLEFQTGGSDMAEAGLGHRKNKISTD